MDVKTGNILFSNSRRFVLIAGPCVIEDVENVLAIAEKMKAVTEKKGIDYVFKASFDKANRSSIDSYRGPGLEKGMKILEKVKNEFDLPVLTDVHNEMQAEYAAQVADIIQIPAFLCRQTDLLVAAGRTGATVNIKKGQFLAPWDMRHVVKKVESTGNRNILLTERGASFGYNNLVTDIRSLEVMRETGYRLIFDATHSVQQPGGLGSTSGGNREYVLPLAKAALTAGIAGIFMEVHPDPGKAMSDGPNMVPLDMMEDYLETLVRIDDVIKEL